MKSRTERLILLLILVVAAALRLYGLNWDEGQHAHPDERWIAMVAPSITWPERVSDILAPRRSTLNPLWVPGALRGEGQVRNFAYGHLPLYMQAFAGHTLASLGRAIGRWVNASGRTDPGGWESLWQGIAQELIVYGEYGGINLVGRVLSVFFDLGTICVTYLLGVRIYDRWVGRIGSALVATSVMHIQLSHFSTFDVITTFFVTLAVYGAVRVLQAGNRSLRPILIHTVWAGAAAGLAIASKFSALPLLAVLVIAQFLRAARRAGMCRHRTWRPGVLLRYSWAYICLGLASAFLAFALASPFALLDWKLYLKQILEQSRMVRGVADWPFTRQYIGTVPFVYQITQQVRWGLGWGLGIVAFAGFVWTIVGQLRRVRPAAASSVAAIVWSQDTEWVMLSWVVPYFFLTGTFMVKFMRYMLPLLPFLVLMGAAMMRSLQKRTKRTIVARRQAATSRNVLVASFGRFSAGHLSAAQCLRYLPYVVLSLTCIYALAYMRVYAQTHPWIQASRWIYAHVPDGAVIAVEHWDDHLPLSLPGNQSGWESDGRPTNLGERGYRHVELPMYEPDGYAKFDLLRDRLREADYIVLSSNRLYRTIPRLPGRYPASTEFYRRLLAGELGYVRVAEFTAYPGLTIGASTGGAGGSLKRVIGWQIVDDDADESFTVYDHPKPIVFRKVRDLDEAEWNAFFDVALARTPVPDEATKPSLLLFVGGWESGGRTPFGQGWLASLRRIGIRWRNPLDSHSLGGAQTVFPLGDDGSPQEETRRSLLLDQPVGELPVVDDFGWNRWASGSTLGSTVLAVLLWWLLITALGWLAWPLTFVAFRGLRDRGASVSRMVALLVVGYLIWLPSSLRWLKNGLPLTYAAIGVLAGCSALLLMRYNGEMRQWLERNRRLVLLSEVIFGLSFLAFVGVRLLNPDLWQPWNGGEKLMDIAYLNSVLRSAYFPPPDPYYAQGYLNYYYYGQFLLSILIRLTGIRATIGFNLAVPLLFAFTVSTAFTIGHTLAAGRVLPADRLERDRRGSDEANHGIAHGLLAALCVAVVGNLASATQVLERLGRVGKSTFTSRVPGLEPLVHATSGIAQIFFRGAQYPGFDYWAPSRVVGLTINEFPYWSFLFADLHPHMINIPFTLLVLAVALSWLRRADGGSPRASLDGGQAQRDAMRRGGRGTPTTEWALVRSSACYLWQRIDWGVVLNIALWPVALGALVPINTWDWPAYAGFSGSMVLFTAIRRIPAGASRENLGHFAGPGRHLLPPVAFGLLGAVALAGVSLLLYAPFMQSYTPIFVGLGWSLGRTHTALGEFLTVWGFFLFVSMTFLLLLVRRRPYAGAGAGLGFLRLIIRYPLRLHRVEEIYSAVTGARGPRPYKALRGGRRPRVANRLRILGALILLSIVVWWAWKGYWVLALMVPLLVLATVLMLQAARRPSIAAGGTRSAPGSGWESGRYFVLALFFTAFLILVGIEFFYLKDHLDGDQMGWWRMNTLFKFYLQVWVMLGIAVGVSLPGLWRAAERWHAGWRWLWSAALALLLVAAALYPLLGTPARVVDRFPGERPPIGSLDGMEFMTVGTYNWPDENNPIPLWGDYQAIRWLQDNVRGTPVLAEAPIGYYREFGVRVSSLTGLPTLVGMHESEQRWGSQVGPRSGQARSLYRTVNLEETMDLIRELAVEYVYLGPLERIEYPGAAAKFAQLHALGYLSLAYRNDLVTIYSVPQ